MVRLNRVCTGRLVVTTTTVALLGCQTPTADPDDPASTGSSSTTTADEASSTSDEADSSGAVDSTDSESTGGPSATCEPGARPGPSGVTDAYPVSGDLTINVRTPPDYDPTIGRPLIVAFSPYGSVPMITAELFENATGLTPLALQAGYVIAYVEYLGTAEPSGSAKLSLVVQEIADDWCIDPDRVFLTGHSDGGGWGQVLLADDDLYVQPHAGAFSASNASGQTMLRWGCPPEPRAAMLIHSVDDEDTPISEGYGFEASLFWATCNQCTDGPFQEGSCMTFTGCAEETLYCETTGPHHEWTGMSTEIIDFFDRNQ